MTERTAGFIQGMAISTLIWVFVCLASLNTTESQFQSEAIERGYAQHNPQTGEWEWKEPVQ